MQGSRLTPDHAAEYRALMLEAWDSEPDAFTSTVSERELRPPEVTQSNAAAVRLYESCGFVLFGTEQFADKLGERFVALVHMWCTV